MDLPLSTPVPRNDVQLGCHSTGHFWPVLSYFVHLLATFVLFLMLLRGDQCSKTSKVPFRFVSFGRLLKPSKTLLEIQPHWVSSPWKWQKARKSGTNLGRCHRCRATSPSTRCHRGPEISPLGTLAPNEAISPPSCHIWSYAAASPARSVLYGKKCHYLAHSRFRGTARLPGQKSGAVDWILTTIFASRSTLGLNLTVCERKS